MVAYLGGSGLFIIRPDGSGLRQLDVFIPSISGVLALNHRGDVLVYTRSTGAGFELIARGVPGVTPGAMYDLSNGLDTQTLTWRTLPSANTHNLYRLDMAAIGPGNMGDCLQGGITATSAVDSSIPPPGGVFGYLVAGTNAAGDGTLGTDSGAIERQAGLLCPPADSDGDGTPDITDTCPLTPDPLQADLDGDGFGDLCDNCAMAANPVQRDLDNNGIGDICDCHILNNPGQPDTDGDGQIDSCDNCPGSYNPAAELVGAPVVGVTAPSVNPALTIGTNTTITWTAADDCGGVSMVDILVSHTGVGGPYQAIVSDWGNTGSYVWTVSGPPTQGPQAYVRVIAKDPAGNSDQAESPSGFRITN